jgi:curli biogenesis system outer membrane secretion channel CsgG
VRYADSRQTARRSDDPADDIDARRTTMRLLALGTIGLASSILIGCSGLNPEPTTEGSRVAPKLRELPPADPANVKTVTVYRFENKTSYQYGLPLSNGMTDQLITGLVKSGHFKVVERAVLEDLMTERDLQASGEAEGSAADKKLMGADLIFAGSVTELDEKGGGSVGLRHWGVGVGVAQTTAQVGLDMRVIDAGTGQILDSIDVRREVKKSGMSAGHRWGIGGGIEISNALDLAVRETLDEAVYQLVTRYGTGSS